MSFNECIVLLRAVISRSSESFHLRNVGLTLACHCRSACFHESIRRKGEKNGMSTLDDGSLKPNQRQDYRDE
jgi:hypothetical protein